MNSPSVANVHRTPKTKASRFARIDNAVLQDERLTFRARGVFAYVLSRPTSWRHSAKSLAGATSDGVDAIRAALNDLRAFGYARQITTRGAGGKIESRWVFTESPDAENPDPVGTSPSRGNPDPAPGMPLPGPGQPGLGEPEPGQPAPGKARPLETTDEETTDEETTVEGEVNAGPAHLPVTFPFPRWADVPERIRTVVEGRWLTDKMEQVGETGVSQFVRSTLPPHWWDERLTEIRGRKLRFKDLHTAAEWCDVLLVELHTAASQFPGLIDREGRKEARPKHRAGRSGDEPKYRMSYAD